MNKELELSAFRLLQLMSPDALARKCARLSVDRDNLQEENMKLREFLDEQNIDVSRIPKADGFERVDLPIG